MHKKKWLIAMGVLIMAILIMSVKSYYYFTSDYSIIERTLKDVNFDRESLIVEALDDDKKLLIIQGQKGLGEEIYTFYVHHNKVLYTKAYQYKQLNNEDVDWSRFNNATDSIILGNFNPNFINQIKLEDVSFESVQYVDYNGLQLFYSTEYNAKDPLKITAYKDDKDGRTAKRTALSGAVERL